MFDDLSFAIRRLRHSPGFTVVALLTLTLAIGVNVSVLSVADTVLFRALPYDDAGRVFVLRMIDRKSGQRYTRVGGEILEAINTHHGGVSNVALLGSGPRLLVEGPDGVEPVATLGVSANFFQVLGVRAAHGRILDASDLAADGRPALLVHSAWRSRFGGDAQIVGRPLSIGGTTLDIVGVLPSDFVFPSTFAGRPEIVTLLPPPAIRGGAFHPVVRLEPGVTRDQAQAEMDALITPITGQNRPASDVSVALDDVRSVIYPVARSVTLLLVAAAALVLLTGAANLASMLLSRTVRRERESGVRAALGASRLRLIRPVLLESLLIAAAGSTLALLAAWATFDLLLPHVPRLAYGNAHVGVDTRIVLLALGMGLIAGLSFAVVPAWRTARVNPQMLIQRGRANRASSRGWFRHPLIAIQVAASIVLVFGAVVTTRAFIARVNVPLGFDPGSVVTISVWPSDRKGSALQDFYATVVERLAARADVEAAGAVGSRPLDSSAPDESMQLPDGRDASAGLVHVLPGYFETTRIRLRKGRLLDWSDVRENSGAALLSESAAAAVFPGRDPLGEIFTNGRGRRFTVVGIVGDVLKSHGVRNPERPPAYIIPGADTRGLTVLARTRPGVTGDAVLADIKRQIVPLAPRAPVTAAWWSETISALSDYRNPRFQTIVLGAFGLLALLLTAVGVFGVISLLVSSRTREIGIRVAIGAQRRDVVAQMARHALAPALAGVCLGLLATRWMARLAEAQLFAVDTNDVMTLAVTAATVLAAAAAAAYLPARHAARVDPVIALRAE